MPHWRLYCHLVWATRRREPLISSPEIESVLTHSLTGTGRDLRITVHAIGMMPEHVHLACSVPPSLALAEAVKHLKGRSSHHLNHTIFADGPRVFAWQAEYGVYSFSARALPDVVAYVQDQPTRHANSNLWSGFETTESTNPTQPPARTSPEIPT